MRSVAPSARWWDQGFFFVVVLFPSKRWDYPATDPVQSDLSYVERFVVEMMMCVLLMSFFLYTVLGLHGWFKTRPVQRLWRGLPGLRNHNLHQISPWTLPPLHDPELARSMHGSLCTVATALSGSLRFQVFHRFFSWIKIDQLNPRMALFAWVKRWNPSKSVMATARWFFATGSVSRDPYHATCLQLVGFSKIRTKPQAQSVPCNGACPADMMMCDISADPTSTDNFMCLYAVKKWQNVQFLSSEWQFFCP